MSTLVCLPWPTHTPLGTSAMAANRMITNSDRVIHKQERHFEKKLKLINFMKKHKKTSPKSTF